MEGALTSLSAADAVCSSAFGSEWRMAEFHDGGGGWNYTGYGYIKRDGVDHYWTYIDDQSANCWD